MSLTAPSLPPIFVGSFADGYLDSPDPEQIPPGATPDARNTFFCDEGQRSSCMMKRPGSRLFNTTAISPGSPIDGLHEFTRETGDPELLAICQGKLYHHDGANFTELLMPLGGSAGFTPGVVVRQLLHRNQSFLFDGYVNRRYDGTALYPVGFAGPTSVTNMVVAAGPGVTGAFVAVYTFYDATHDHEGNPSPETAPLVVTNQQRQHTKPGGPVASSVTHWRIYVRRADTYEKNYFRITDVPIATTTWTEAESDAARQQDLIAPLPATNDPPPPYAIMNEHLNYGIGVPLNTSRLDFSRVGDFESWNASDRFYVARGDGRPIRAVAKYGTTILIQKPTHSWTLVGDRVPFKIDPIHGSFGCVSQEAGLEIDNRYFGWDEVHGPYVTDTVQWTPLADRRIRNIINTINRNELVNIRVGHDKAQQLVMWAVAQQDTTRRRMLLAYHYGLNVWLPPITGLEYASLCTFTFGDGSFNLLMGDYWGRVHILYEKDSTRDSVPDGTVMGTAAPSLLSSGEPDPNTLGLLSDPLASFYTEGSGLAGLSVAVKAPDGTWQWRRIASNTPQRLTLDTVNDRPWDFDPAGLPYIVGGIDWYWRTPKLTWGDSSLQKRGGHFGLIPTLVGVDHVVEVYGSFDDPAMTGGTAHPFKGGSGAFLWGSGIWGVALWGGTIGSRLRKQRLLRSFFVAQFTFTNVYPDQPVDIAGYRITADVLPRRSVPGVPA